MTITLRPYLPSDVPALIDIFRASVEEIANEDYSEGQIEAWVAAADDAKAFAARLGSQLTLIAQADGELAGFASMKGVDHVDLLYVHPGFTRRRVATILCDALEKLAGARGAAKISVDASDTARPFFEARGYIAERRNTVQLGEQWLGNTTMRKPLAANDSHSISSPRGPLQ